jgi:PAS domain S-box-containing protein
MSDLVRDGFRRLRDYVLAIALAAVALLLRKLLPIEPGVGLYPLPLSAIIVSAWRGGRGPGLVATFVSAAGIASWFLYPAHTLGSDWSSSIGFTIFIAVAVLATEFSMARRRAEMALRESESRLRQIAETTPGVLWVVNLEPRQTLYVNPSYERVWGSPAKNLLGATDDWPSAVHPDDEERVAGAFDRWLGGQGEDRLEIEYRIVRPDGKTRWIHDRGVLIRNERGHTTRATGIADDITERRQAQEALRRSEAYLAETQKLSHTGSWAWVPASDEIRYLSEECHRILGLVADGNALRLESTLLRRVHPEDESAARDRLAQANVQAADFELEYRIVDEDGSARDVYVVGHPVFSPPGRLVEFVGTLVDVTERNRAERERERLLRAQADLERINRVSTMGELAASLAHEIRQPIAAALTNAHTCLRWLDRNQPDIAEAHAAASRAADDATRAADIITRVRSLFQKAAPRRESIDVNVVVQGIASMLRGEAHRNAVSLRTELAADLPSVMADRVQLQQVLMNLVLNGIDAMKGSDSLRDLTIATRRDGEACVVSVTDTGPGLPLQQADRIFDAFFTTKSDGTGMGLAISRSIVEAHGGRLWAEPRPGRGAAFHFTLPVSAVVDG